MDDVTKDQFLDRFLDPVLQHRLRNWRTDENGVKIPGTDTCACGKPWPHGYDC